MLPVRTGKIDALMDGFRKRCGEAGLSRTHQREIIYCTLVKTGEHPSPESIYEKVRQKIPSISLATVYKNIRIFLDNGLLSELSPHHGTLRLETNPDPHHHMICTRCKAIVDIEESAIGPVRLLRRLPRGFHVKSYSVEFHGLCRTCAKL